jgi:hypothetical protein
MKSCTILFCAVLVAGCATPYQTNRNLGLTGVTGGYSDMLIAENTYRVTVSGNGYTSAPTLDEYLLRRASELTIENGFNYFVISDRNTDIRTVTINQPARTTATATVDTVAPQVSGTQQVNVTTTTRAASTTNAEFITLVGTVLMVSDENAADLTDQVVFDARIISSNFVDE